MSNDSLTLGGEHGRRVLRLYHLYRLIAGLLLVLLISSNLDDRLLELTHARLFRQGSWVYLIVNIFVAVLVQRPRYLQFFSLALLDVLMLAALFYAAGGISSGLGSLLIVAVAIANILLRGNSGLLIAACAALSFILPTFYLSLSRPDVANQFIQAGALGALCFAVALVVQNLTNRVRVSESLARQRANDVANLEALNSLILQRMRTGILLLDADQRVLQANQSAQAMLGVDALRGEPLAPHCPELLQLPATVAVQPVAAPAQPAPGAGRPHPAAQLQHAAARRAARHAGLSRRHLGNHPARPGNETGLPRPTDRRHRPRDPQPAGRHQPRRATAA